MKNEKHINRNRQIIKKKRHILEKKKIIQLVIISESHVNTYLSHVRALNVFSNIYYNYIKVSM